MPRLKATVAAVARAFLRPLAAALFRAPPNQRNILFASHSSLTAGYLAEIWALLKDDPRLRCHLALKHPEHHAGDWQASRALLPLTELSTRAANLRPWDLVLMADHAGVFRHVATPERHPVIRISHGIGGKRIDGEDYFYGSRLRDPKGRLLYSLMFESSRARRDAAVRADPSLAPHIAVVGSRRADLLRERLAQRARSRPPGEAPTVLIASSWGPGNLFFRFDESLLAACAALRGRFRFVLRPHPHLLRTSTSGGRTWQDVFNRWTQEGLAYSPPESSLVDAIGSADALVVDDLTSVGLLAAIAGARVAVAPSGSASVGDDTFLARLRATAPKLESPAGLSHTLDALFGPWPPPDLATLVAEMNSEPGRSAPLMREAIYSLLRLTPPANA